MPDREREKREAASAAAALVRDGDMVGLGTGSTVAYLLPALAARRLQIRAVATSPATEHEARALGIAVEPFEGIASLDIAIDGADQVDPRGWLVKGGGGAHTREKVVAMAAERFVVIVSSDKAVEQLTAPIPDRKSVV
jgi:ribose 5-phosphate isomerase A